MLWQVLQLIRALFESRGSKYSILPSSILSGVNGLRVSWDGASGIGLKILLARSLRDSLAAAGRLVAIKAMRIKNAVNKFFMEYLLYI
jgi:hypothetical protein